MYARLWWKDLRQFWPIWLFLVIAAAAGQRMLLLFGPSVELSRGTLPWLAIFWTSLYAMTAGSAAFAGEREVGGLRLLDSLPAPRRVVWSAKVSFAIFSSVALALVLFAMAALNTDFSKLDRGADGPEIVIAMGSIFFSLGWGLFFSSFSKSAMTAAVLGIVVCCLSLFYLPSRVVSWNSNDAMFTSMIVIGTTIATMAASAVIFSAPLGMIRIPTRSWIRFRSPIVLDFARPAPPVRVERRSPITPAPWPPFVGERMTTTGAIRLFPRSWSAEYMALAWQTIREGRRLWCLLFAVGCAIPLVLGQRGAAMDPELLFVLDVLGLIAAGVSVFGIEHQAGSQRILAYHSARPRLAWLAKLSVWSIGLTIVGIVQPLIYILWGNNNRGPTWSELTFLVLGGFVPFGIALICGMAIRRTITAAVIALVFTLVIGGSCAGLAGVGMFPLVGFPILGLALLGISGAWTGDWMLDRPAPGRWLRLAGLVSGTFVVLFSWYVAHRAWGVSDPGPIPSPASWSAAATILDSPDRNAAGLYRKAYDLAQTTSGNGPRSVANQKQLLELLRQATARPDCVFIDPRKMTINSDRNIPGLQTDLSTIFVLEHGQRMNQGDLAGAWAWIMLELRMARHEAQTMTNMTMTRAMRREQTALSRALEWSVDPRQTLELLRAAGKDLHDLSPMPTMADIVSAEANILEQTFNLPLNDLKRALNEYMIYNGRTPFRNAGLIEVSTTPWELTRARRVIRQWAAETIRFPSQSYDAYIRIYLDTRNIFTEPWAHPLVLELVSSGSNTTWMLDQQLMGLRALEQVVAIRSWQLRHEGAFPDRLEQLVPEELDRLPLDPYSNQPFRYVIPSGQQVAAIGDVLSVPYGMIPDHLVGENPRDGRLLYSIGPDRSDNLANRGSQQINNDIVFAIPPLKTKTGPRK